MFDVLVLQTDRLGITLATSRTHRWNRTGRLLFCEQAQKVVVAEAIAHQATAQRTNDLPKITVSETDEKEWGSRR